VTLLDDLPSSMAKNPHATAAILSIGDELTLGQKLDTNAQWLSIQLSDRGVMPMLHVTVSDGLDGLATRIESLAKCYDLLVMTGGLGPTADDLTRHALAQASGDQMVEDSDSLAALIARFDNAGLVMAEANRVQAQRPSSAACIENPMGTAPGLHAVIGNTDVFCLPGPPSENQPMFLNHVAPLLRPERLVLTRILPTVGMGESAMADCLNELMDRDRNPLIGTTASSSVVSVRLRYEGKDSYEGKRLLDESESLVRCKIGDHVFSSVDQSLAKTVVDLLLAQGATLSTVESCTGGMIGQRITDIAGSSAAYLGGFVTYTNQLKVQQVGVQQNTLDKHGAVSRDVCEQMVLGGRDETGSDYAISVTGIAGPGGGSAEKPIGTVWIGLVGPDGSEDLRRFRFTGDRDQVRNRAATMALAMLWGMLTDIVRVELFWETRN
jgi:nicotinamide-nucleotide amidase